MAKRRRRGRKNDAGSVDWEGELGGASSTRGTRHRKDLWVEGLDCPLLSSLDGREDISASRSTLSKAAITVGLQSSPAIFLAISLRNTQVSRGASTPTRTA